MKNIIFSCLIISGIMFSNLNFAAQRNIYAATIPKSGTNLLAKALRLLTGRQAKRYSSPRLLKGQLPKQSNTILYSHVHHDTGVEKLFADYDYTCFFMIRDPRDLLISKVFWLVSHPQIYPHQAKKYSEDSSFFSHLLTRHIKLIKKTYDEYLPWMKNPRVYTVKFEDLVGRQGGESQRKQLNELRAIARHIGLETSETEIQKVADSLFGGTMTFRKGQTGSWKKHFTDAQKKLFKKVAGQLLIDLGYEKDFNW